MEEPEGPGLVEQECPECGELDHEVLRATSASWVLRCTTCGFTRTVPAPALVRTRPVPVILSAGPTSETRQLEVPVDGRVAEGDEFDVDGHRVLVTAVESVDGRRPRSLPARDVKVVYAMLFDTVTLHYTVNQGETTRSFQEAVPPEEEIHIGAVREVQGIRLAVKTLKSDQNRTLHRGHLLARNVRRVFADLAAPGRRVGERVRTRTRGRLTPKGARDAKAERKAASAARPRRRV